ncbi:beta-ketoacyl synthase N-terminal-like domain-containing protein [Sphaerisporangium rhizosphaerae]|uniref:Beta-ketoacyl synthase N-terminal-like domain-containing protein n=1 Tax=Sphaerisporangium rhizosphaerae TaxID=2269375 RepID=A0ABW2PGH4_9ACTN
MQFEPPHTATVPSRAAVRSYVRQVVAGVLGLDPGALAGPDALRELGMDSITRMNITLRFERDLGEMAPTLMFEHHTIDALADHFLSTRRSRLSDLLPTQDGAAASRVIMEEKTDRPVPERSYAEGAIAVVAVTGRYPGAPDISTLWRNLRDGVVSITEVPPDRWDWREHHDPRRGRLHTTYGRWGGFIEGVADFDAEFFGILPSDAAVIDPQERLFLHTCWDLLEGAGRLGAATHQPDTGVFVGTMSGSYGKLGATEWPLGKLVGANSAPWSIANRVSYVFDFHGPSFAVDSACSSSLTAIHLACESLRRGECSAAIAGGVNLILHPAHLVGLSASTMLSSDRFCKVFDAAADGFVPGEGVGAVLLKPLSAALADGDRVWGVITAGALNTAGRTSGFTVPNPAVQADLVTVALGRAGLRPRDITYVEAHGTGTSLGDPLEMAALARSLEPGRPRDQACAVGSLKANVGHLEGAAGIAGLTKVLLQLQHRHIAPCAALHTLNPKIAAVASALHFPRYVTPWRAPGEGLLRAGVSSFGAGGANAHLIVEEFRTEAPATDAASGQTPHREHVVLLSARTGEQLRALATAVGRDLSRAGEDDHDEDLLRRLAYTTQVGRREMRERLAVTCSRVDELSAALEEFGTTGRSARAVRGTASNDGQGDPRPEDEDDQNYVAALMEKLRVDRLARLWVEGMPVDWSRLWPGRPVRRVELPPYPFDMKRYWAPAGPVPAAAPHPSGLTPGTSADAPPLAPPTAASAEIVEDPAAPLTGKDAITDPLPDAADEASFEVVEQDLRTAAGGFLLVDPHEVDIDADLMKLGFDSIALVRLMAEVDELYGADADPGIIFDHPTLRSLARYLITEHPAAVAARRSRRDADG